MNESHPELERWNERFATEAYYFGSMRKSAALAARQGVTLGRGPRSGARMFDGTGGPKQLDHLYTEALLRSSFAALEIVHLASHDSVLREGPGHSGMSALVDLVARKRNA